MGDSQDGHPRRKSVVSLSTPKTVECRRASTTAALTTIHIPSVFDLTAFVGVGEPGGISLEISIPQTRQKPESRASLQSALPPLPTSLLLWWIKIWRVEGKNLPILLQRAQKAHFCGEICEEKPQKWTHGGLWRRPALMMGSEFHCIWNSSYIGWFRRRPLVHSWLPRLEITTQKLY